MPQTTKPLELGVHINLPEEQHHADKGLGSGRIQQLYRDPTEYWWDSPMNPRRPSQDGTDATAFGKAVHKAVLEGDAAFRKVYVRRPDDQEGATPAEKGALTKAAKAKLKESQTLLHGEDFDRVLGAEDSIKLDPHLAEAFTGGLPEVTLIWEDQGVRLKARIDYLKPRACVDLKNVTVTLGSFPRSCLRLIQEKHDTQAALYLRGRAQLKDMLRRGKVWTYGDQRPDIVLLDKAAASAEYAFVFVFLRANSAPVTFARMLSPGNPILDTAGQKVDAAIARYLACMKQFGDGGTMWLPGHKLEELQPEELSPYYGMDIV